MNSSLDLHSNEFLLDLHNRHLHVYSDTTNIVSVYLPSHSLGDT